MNQELVLVIIGIAVAALVLRPLLRGRGAAPMVDARPSRAQVPASSDELTELELDHSMGRVSEADYSRWREEITPEAVGEAPPEATSSPATTVASAEALVEKWRKAPRPACATCGERPEPEARFCSNCGASLGV